MAPTHSVQNTAKDFESDETVAQLEPVRKFLMADASIASTEGQLTNKMLGQLTSQLILFMEHVAGRQVHPSAVSATLSAGVVVVLALGGRSLFPFGVVSMPAIAYRWPVRVCGCCV